MLAQAIIHAAFCIMPDVTGQSPGDVGVVQPRTDSIRCSNWGFFRAHSSLALSPPASTRACRRGIRSCWMQQQPRSRHVLPDGGNDLFNSVHEDMAISACTSRRGQIGSPRGIRGRGLRTPLDSCIYNASMLDLLYLARQRWVAARAASADLATLTADHRLAGNCASENPSSLPP